MKLSIFFIIILLFSSKILFAQSDSTFFKRLPRDTSKIQLNLDAVYNRPFLQAGKIPIAIGGYVESKIDYFQTDGISEGFNFAMQRTTIFISSSIHRKIKFLSEIEFEDGAKEINIEFASLDFQFLPLLNLRSGIIMNPIGAFNQNHDGPKWEFNDRPISATQLLPATFSNVGMGLWGKYTKKNWILAYETYLTNGFDSQIIDNSENKTFLPASKQNADRFEESFNGKPLFTGKIAIRHRKIGEIGLSNMNGIYNKFEDDGLILDKKRRLNVWAIDFNSTLPKIKTFINGEFAFVKIDVPNTFTQQFGNQQHGGFVDIVQPILQKKMLGFEKATLNFSFRIEYVDWNKGLFNETNDKIGDEIWAFTPSLSFRPTAQTVLRLNYKKLSQTDILGNPPAKTAGFSFGISSYF